MNRKLVRSRDALACSATLVHRGRRPRRSGPGRATQSEFAQAAANAKLANEAFVRSDRLMMDWLTLADPRSGLLPRNTTADRDIWNAKDCAADLYPFLVLTAWFTRPELYEGRMQEMLLTETALTARIGRLPDTYSFSKQGFADARIDTAAIMFGGVGVREGWADADHRAPRRHAMARTHARHRRRPVAIRAGRDAPRTDRVARSRGERRHAARAVAPLLDDARRAVPGVRDAARRLLPPGCSSPDARLRDAAAARPRQRGDRGAHGAVRDAAARCSRRRRRRIARPSTRCSTASSPSGRNEDGLFYNSIDPRAGKPVSRASPTTSATC